MRHRIVSLAVLASLTQAARAEDWKNPSDGVLTEKHIDDYDTFLEHLVDQGTLTSSSV